MCGIAGWFSSSPLTEQEHLAPLQRMIAAIVHRGPDGCGTFIHPHAAFGHARLAIIDLAAGRQPMHSHDGRYTIIFNGEIYNYREVKSALEQCGHCFNTHSDTEVIMELYRMHGWQGFNHLRGMYAFALWDHQTQRGLLARDPLGIKPLFLRHEGTGICFASEAKAILARDNQRAELDCAALHLLMNFRYVPGERSMFKGITQLAPGVVVEWSADGEQKLFQLHPELPQTTSPLDALRGSVRAHFAADVEVGAYLSGGIDSAAIVALGKEYSGYPLRTFTLKVGDDPNEAANAARSALLLGLANIQETIPEDLAAQLPQLVWHLETPKINALQVAQLAQLTARHVKVALSGLGGDELFYGYHAHKILLDAHHARRFLPDFVARRLGAAGAKLAELLRQPLWTETERAFRMLRALGDWPRVYGLLRNVWDSPELRAKIYGPRLLDQPLPDAFGEIEQRWPEHPDPVSAMAQYEFRNKMVNDLLWQEDRVSMAAGLEVRVPFVDAHFAAQLQRVDRATLMPHHRLKGYMRAMLAEVLPREILDRRKSGFQVSSPEFYHRHLAPLAQQYLNPQRIAEVGLFNPAFVAQVLAQRPTKGMRWHYFMLYLMLLTHLWIELFEAGHVPRSIRPTD
ncbi:MAG: asparagine synthase (glutamine-hydrolyzing) [Pseudomonadota bacterium]